MLCRRIRDDDCDNHQALTSSHFSQPSTLAGRPAGSKDAEQRQRRQSTQAEKKAKAEKKRKKKQHGSEAAKKAFVDGMVSSSAVQVTPLARAASCVSTDPSLRLT